MFYTISKLFTLFLMPFFWLFICILWALFTNSQKKRKNAIRVAFLILFIFGNSFLASKIMKYWEPMPKEISKIGKFDVAIVLGGGITNDTKRPFDRIHFDYSADRLLQAFQLYKMGVVKKILISAGTDSNFAQKNHKTEAELSRKFLLICGVDSANILIDSRSLNTYQNASFSKLVLKNAKLDHSKLLLITSAYHMKRSVLCFEKQGLKVESFPSNFAPTSTGLLTFYTIVPDEDAFSLWFDLLHEWYGIVIYKLMGYI
jgi:uncharacterized SAM-binding protein YcdF (DUF218 family)